VRSNPDVSAERVKEHASKAIPSPSHLRASRRSVKALAERRSIKGYWRGCKKKPIAPGVRKFCYPGPGTRCEKARQSSEKGAFPVLDLLESRIELRVRIWSRLTGIACS
jgi:hypothetical protein